jgi:hypothetical protein
MRSPARHINTIRARVLTAWRFAGAAHHGDDLLDRGRIGRVVPAFVAWWAAAVVVGEGRRRPATSGRVEQNVGGHAAERAPATAAPHGMR